MSSTGLLPHMKDLVPSTEWQEAIIGAKQIVVTLFDTLLQLAVGVSLVCLAWAIPYAVLRMTCFRSIDRYLFVGALVLISASCYCSTELGWTPIPSEQGPDIPYELQIFAWGLWIGGFLAIVPGVGAAWDAFARPRLPAAAAARVAAGLALAYALSLLATSLGNWTRDGAGWHLNDAGFAKQAFCYSVFLTAGAVGAHAVSTAVVGALDVCYMGSHFPSAVVMTALSWGMILAGAFFAEEHGGHGLWTFSLYMHFEIALSVLLVFGGTHVYVLAIAHALCAPHVTGLVGNVKDVAAGVALVVRKFTGNAASSTDPACSPPTSPYGSPRGGGGGGGVDGSSSAAEAAAGQKKPKKKKKTKTKSKPHDD